MSADKRGNESPDHARVKAEIYDRFIIEPDVHIEPIIDEFVMGGELGPV